MYQDASTTLTCADTAQVHTGLDHPGQGQRSSELHHDKKGGQGLTSLADTVSEHGAGRGVGSLKDDPAHAAQRNLDDVPTWRRGTVGGPAAQKQEPVKADQL